ncbi:MAG: 3-oxoacyl-ACP synthase [Bacteroidia bacterium]|nr:3-oxoacyl-ACP synthase [Bacteroidia bacterium]
MRPIYINATASIHPIGRSEGVPFLQAHEPDYKIRITNSNLRRRMSRIIRMGVACGLECLASVDPEEIDAIITGTGLGCLADTEKFMNAIVDQAEQLLNPTPFIQSTFNTIGAQLALLLQVHGYNTTYVHRGISFESALLDGMMRIAEGDRQVLVGAIDELTPTSYAIQQRLGLFRHCLAGEGSSFFLLSGEQTANTLAEIRGIKTLIQENPKETVVAQTTDFLAHYQLTPEEIGCLIEGTHALTGESSGLHQALFPQAEYGTFKEECGEFPTAAAYGLFKAIKRGQPTAASGLYTLLYNRHYANQTWMLIKQIG